MKVITFTGLERCDFAYHTARVLATQADNVIVIDNSRNHEMYEAVSQGPDGEEDNDHMVVRNNITFLKDVEYSPDFFNSFDYIVMYEGMRYRLKDLEQSSLVFAMPDFLPASLEAMKGLPDNVEYIMRDGAGKLNERSAAEIMEIDPDRIVGTLPYEYNDYSCYLSLIYNGRQKLKGLSPEFTQALAYVCGRAMEIDEKQAIALIKKARKS